VEGDAATLTPKDIEAQLAALDVTSLPRPFEWPAAGSGGGIIPLLYVSPDARGAGVAPRLLAGLNEEMFAAGASSVEAHIDVENLPSARAFRKAGFELFLMSTGDLWARKKADR
jgi:ribosomal protein S18 acetylase RimI-like enzyme